MRRVKQLYASMIYLFLYLPILVLIAYSFNASKFSTEWKGLTLQWYESLLQNDSLLEAAFNSLSIALLSALLATAIGTLGAVALARWRYVGRGLMQGLVFVLVMSPEIVMGIALLMLFISVGLPLGFWSLLLAHVTFCLPFVVVTVLGRFSGFDTSVIEAAKDLGADEMQTFLRVVLPMLLPAVIAGFLLSFTLSLDDVIISFFVTGAEYQILPLKIYSMVRLGVKPEINALCTILFVLTLFVVMGMHHFLMRDTPKAGREQ